MANRECWTVNDGGEGEIGEKYREMTKDRSEGTRPKGSPSCFEMHVVGLGNDQSGLPTRSGVEEKGHATKSEGIPPRWPAQLVCGGGPGP